jgi:hypothetical protein
MKRTPPVLTDDVRPEYDFAAMKDGVRGKYVQRVREGSNIVLIEPEVAEVGYHVSRARCPER